MAVSTVRGISTNPLITGIERVYGHTIKSFTFDGTTGNGEVGAGTLFTTTGEVEINILVPFCTTNLAGASATIALGVTASTALFVAATTATDIDANEFWVDASPDANGILIPAALKQIAITKDIIFTVAVANLTGGVLRFDVWWRKLSPDGNLT